jgi:hypothetical protein
MLIVEHFFLIASDPSVGLPTWPRRTQSVPVMSSAALMLDLTLQRRLHLHNSLLRGDPLPLEHPLLADALHAIQAHELPAPLMLATLVRRLTHLPQQVLEGLFRRDLVHRTATRRWLLGRKITYPLRSVQARNEALLRLRQAVHSDADLHGLALLLLADVTGLLPVHLDAREHEQASRRLLALNQQDAQPDETLHVFSMIRAALLA